MVRWKQKNTNCSEIVCATIMNNVVGRYIKKIREQQNLTQEQLAIRIEMAGWQIDRFVVSKIERGDRQVSDIEAQLIAKALKVLVSQLFGEK